MEQFEVGHSHIEAIPHACEDGDDLVNLRSAPRISADTPVYYIHNFRRARSIGGARCEGQSLMENEMK